MKPRFRKELIWVFIKRYFQTVEGRDSYFSDALPGGPVDILIHLSIAHLHPVFSQVGVL